MLKIVVTVLVLVAGLLVEHAECQSCTLGCLNGGVCISLGGAQEACACKSGFSGSLCDIGSAVVVTTTTAKPYVVNSAACASPCQNGKSINCRD